MQNDLIDLREMCHVTSFFQIHSIKGKKMKLNGNLDRRRSPRMMMDLPLEYRMVDFPKAHGGLVINVSETGLLLHSIRDLPIGTMLNIAVLFPREYELSNFNVSAEIVWKDQPEDSDLIGYRYGLKFVEILKEDYWKLTQLLSGEFRLDNLEVSMDQSA